MEILNFKEEFVMTVLSGNVLGKGTPADPYLGCPEFVWQGLNAGL